MCYECCPVDMTGRSEYVVNRCGAAESRNLDSKAICNVRALYTPHCKVYSRPIVNFCDIQGSAIQKKWLVEGVARISASTNLSG